ncbi:MAG: hypothetical protein K2X86_03305 [Cytophagaceae bacterium]|nr:hypothetical protein [Cytophagaceae bacterium]
MGIKINNYPRIQQLLKNAEANILFLASLSDKKLAEKLETIHLQSEIAEQKNIQHSIELLEIWRSQVIAARIYKAENEIPDAPDEIKISIADIETLAVRLEHEKNY